MRGNRSVCARTTAATSPPAEHGQTGIDFQDDLALRNEELGQATSVVATAFNAPLARVTEVLCPGQQVLPSSRGCIPLPAFVDLALIVEQCSRVLPFVTIDADPEHAVDSPRD